MCILRRMGDLVYKCILPDVSKAFVRTGRAKLFQQMIVHNIPPTMFLIIICLAQGIVNQWVKFMMRFAP